MSSPSLRYPALLFITVLVTVVILLGVTLPGHSLLINALQDSGHFLIFTLLSLLVLWSYKTAVDRLLWPILFGCMLFGVVIELVQSTIGREASLYDLLMDAMGIASGGLLFSGIVRGSISRGLSVLVALLLFMTAFTQPLYWLSVSLVRNAAFPTLVNLDSAIAKGLLEGRNGGDVRIIKRPASWSTDIAETQQHCAIVRLEKGAWPGVGLIEPEPDWRGFELLELSFYSEQKGVQPLYLRINDRAHNNKFNDRFNRKLELSHGYNNFTIPLKEIEDSPVGRSMDLSAIEDLLIFGTKHQVGNEFFLLSIGLR